MSGTHTNLLFHIVFSTKFRRNLITQEFKDRLYEYTGGIIREQKGILLTIGGMPDHIHILAKLSPTLAVSDVLRIVKANTSKWFNETFEPTKKFRWQSGFGAFSVSKSGVPVVTKYIQTQEKHHQKLTFRDEYRLMLQRHEIDFDEKFLFEEEHIE